VLTGERGSAGFPVAEAKRSGILSWTQALLSPLVHVARNVHSPLGALFGA
jgi:hypothetical protein